MKQYSNGKRTIKATEKMYNLIYKQQGFRALEEQKDFSKMKVDELKELAREKGIENYSSIKKDELVKVLRGEE